MDPSARHRLPAPQNAARAQPSTRSDPPPMMSEIDGRVDQLALVQDTLLNGAHTHTHNDRWLCHDHRPNPSSGRVP